MTRQGLVALAIVVLLSGCDAQSPGAPPHAAAAATDDLAGWLRQLPRASSVAVGDQVWAAVPCAEGRTARVAVHTVVEVDGSQAVVVDALDRQWRVPAALAHPVAPLVGDLAIGQVVLADRWQASKIVGRVSRIAGGDVFVTYDWNGQTVEDRVDVAVPLPAADGVVLRWLAYRDAGSHRNGSIERRGLAIAADSERVWVSEDDGAVRVIARSEVRPLELATAELAPGAAVKACSWSLGCQPGVLVSVLEPGLRYEVELATGSSRAYFFAALAVTNTK